MTPNSFKEGTQKADTKPLSLAIYIPAGTVEENTESDDIKDVKAA